MFKDSLLKYPLREVMDQTYIEPNNLRSCHRNRHFQKPLIKLLSMILLCQTIVGTAMAVEPNAQTFYNPYKVQFFKNTENEIRGYAIASDKYNPEQHSQALRHLTQGLQGTHDFEIDSKGIPVGLNNPFIYNISFSFGAENQKTGILTITDSANKRFTIPEEVLERRGPSEAMRLEMLGFKLQNDPLSFSFTDLRDSANVFIQTKDCSLVFMDKFIQIDFQLPSQRVFGFGERTREFALKEGTWTMWARQPSDEKGYDDGTGGKQSYGVHPFILVQGKHAGDFFGIFFRNANAQSPLLKFRDDGTSILSYITVGGVLEIDFYMHGTAREIIAEYQRHIGLPQLPPFWSLGWASSSYAFQTEEDIQQMVKNYKSVQFPLETVFLDIPYMDNFNDFTVNKTAFPHIGQLAADLHDNRQKLVVILDPGLQVNDNNKYYQMAQQLNALIMSTVNTQDNNGAVTLKSVNGGQDVFLDFFNFDSATVWQEGLLDLNKQVEFDGIWLDMNEITGFCNSECPQKQQPPEQEVETDKYFLSQQRRLETHEPLKEADYSWYKTYPQDVELTTLYLPFIPGFSNAGGLEDGGAISLNATHHQYNYETEYNLHSLNGFAQTEHTYAFLTANKSYPHTDSRPFILTRSTFSGSGRFASHWTGDNWREWSNLNYSIAGIMNMNMFGIPHTGANICGFNGELLDQEMCTRWIQLAQFYPFARIHYNATFQGKPVQGSEPYNLEGEYRAMAREAYYARYQYLRLMYTCLFEAHSYGHTCFDPLFYHYPEDEKTFDNIEESFIVASALKVSPILTSMEGKATYPSYFPKGKWVSMTDFTKIVEGDKIVDLEPQSTVNVHLMEGKLIPFQPNNDHSASVTDQLLEKPIQLIAHRDKNGRATGSILLERGRSRSELYENHFEYYELVLQSNTLHKYMKQGQHGTQKTQLEKLIIVDASDLKDTDFACVISHRLEIIPLQAAFDNTQNTLNISVNQALHINFHNIRQINFGNSKKELNLCDPESSRYTVKGDVPDLSKSSVSFIATHNTHTLPDLNVTLRITNSNTLNVKWTYDKVPEGWRVPFEVPEEIINKQATQPYGRLSNYVDVETEPFKLSILNPSSKATVLTVTDLFLHDYLNYIGEVLNTTRGDEFTGIFGLGERAQSNIFYEDGVYNIWNQDQEMIFDDGRPSSKALQGNHPFYMYKNSDSSWVGVFHNLVANQDYFIKNYKDQGVIEVTMMAVGGLADLYYIVDSTPLRVLQNYFEIVGKPVMIPQWALGWHQSRTGYKSTEDLKWVVGNYSEHDLPLDSIWSDDDYMSNFRDFTVDSQRYSSLQTFVDDLHKKDMKYVPILDSGIAVRPWGTYEAYDAAVEQDVFVKINKGKTFIGQGPAKDQAYPDFFNQRTQKWWGDELKLFKQRMIDFDGIWLGNNEASNRCSGVCYPDQAVDDPVKHNLIYTPGNRDMEYLSVPMDAYHSNGYQEIDTHSLFGTMETLATYNWEKQRGERRLLTVSRSASAGHGKYGSKWLGDNESSPKYMGQSVTGIMMQNMFGIAFAGADICGYHGDTNPELCARWYLVGAFQPFSRNHNSRTSLPQEPYRFAHDYYEPGIVYLDIIHYAMKIKYSLVRYFYTVLMQMSIHGGSPLYRPLFFDFPNDVNATKDVENNVMLGSSLKLSLLSNQIGKNSSDFYFPEGKWCNILKYTQHCFVSKGEFKTYRTKAYDAYLHLREGHIVVYQDAFKFESNNILELQQNPIELLINGKQSYTQEGAWYATGKYYNDDGLGTEIQGRSNAYTFIASQAPKQDSEPFIIIQVQTTQLATEYKKQDNPDCYAVNQNDYLEQVRIFDALAISGIRKALGVVQFVDGRSIVAGRINVDEDTRQLVFTLSKPLCLTAISYIEITSID